MYPLNRKLFFILLCCFAVSCSTSDPKIAEDPTGSTGNSSQEKFTPPSEAGAYLQPPIGCSATYQLQVRNVKNSTERINNAVAALSGNIADTHQTYTGSTVSCRFVIKIPDTQFHQLLEALEEESISTKQKRIQTTNSTEEIEDLKARLKTKREVRDRYISILRIQTNTAEERLETTEKIRLIQEEIESQEERLRFLQHQVAFCTVHLDIYQKIKFKAQSSTYRDAFDQEPGPSFLKAWALKIHWFFTVYMTGLVWFVQIVHYPMMAAVGASAFVAYERKNVQLTGWVTAPQMLIELGSGLLLLWLSSSNFFFWINIIMLAGIWASTFFIQVPYHNRLTEVYDLSTVRKLSRSNWIRTLLWSMRSILLLLLLE